MKKVLGLIFVLSSFVAFSQSTTFQSTATTKLVNRGLIVVDSGLIMTAKDTTSWFGLKSDFVRKASNGKMYLFDGTKYTELGPQNLQSVTEGAGNNITTRAIQTGQLIVVDTVDSRPGPITQNRGAVTIHRDITRNNQDQWGFVDYTQFKNFAYTGVGTRGYASNASGPGFYNITNMDHTTNFQGLNWYENSNITYTEGLAISGYLTTSTIGEWHGATVEFPAEESGIGTNTIGTMYGYRVWNKGAPLSASIPKYAFHSADASYMSLFGGKVFTTGLTSATVTATDKMLVVDSATGEIKKVALSGGTPTISTNIAGLTVSFVGTPKDKHMIVTMTNTNGTSLSPHRFTVNFSTPFTSLPAIVTQAATAAGASLTRYVTGVTTSGFTLECNTILSPGGSATYHVIVSGD